MALRVSALAAVVTAAGCERLPAGQYHGEVIWEREVGTLGAGLAAASGGDLFTSDGAVWELGVHGHVSAFAAGSAADGDVQCAAGHLEGTPGFGTLPDPAASGTEPLPSDQPSFLVSVEAATGAVRWQRGLERSVEGPLVADAARGLYLVEGYAVLVARED